MARHTTIATAIDKYKISSTTVYLILLEFDIVDPDTRTTIELFRIANNNETFQWRGNSYAPANFEMDVTFEQDKPPVVSMSLRDHYNVIQPRMQAYGGMMGSNVRMIVVNASVTDNPPEMDDSFKILSASANAQDYIISFVLGAENPLGLRFPPRLQYRDRCFWQYKGAECGYSGGLTSCDFTQHGENGCSVHNNTTRFGGFPSLGRKI